MQLASLSKRLDKVEAVLSPEIGLLLVVIGKGETREEATLRVAKENGFTEVPEDIALFIFNFHGEAATNNNVDK